MGGLNYKSLFPFEADTSDFDQKALRIAHALTERALLSGTKDRGTLKGTSLTNVLTVEFLWLAEQEPYLVQLCSTHGSCRVAWREHTANSPKRRASLKVHRPRRRQDA